MRFLCFGVGAIGTYIGGSLALDGQEVVFIDRPEVAASIGQNGLRLQFPDGERTVTTAKIVCSLAEARTQGPYHLAICAVKAL